MSFSLTRAGITSRQGQRHNKADHAAYVSQKVDSPPITPYDSPESPTGL